VIFLLLCIFATASLEENILFLRKNVTDSSRGRPRPRAASQQTVTNVDALSVRLSGAIQF
jgi:hypothetical protein